MNLKYLSDDQLLANTEALVKKERNVLTQVLHHLREVEARRLYAKLDHSSLYAYCINVLKYSEGQAQRRISAMRLLREIPEVEEKLSTGELSLSNVAYAVSFFRQEAQQSQKPLPKQDKKQVLKQLENCSSRQGQKVLLSLSANPEQAIKRNLEKQRVVTPKITQVSFGADEQLLQKLNRLKGLLAHKKPHLGTAELVNEMCELALNQLDPLRKSSKVKKTDQASSTKKPTYLGEKLSNEKLVNKKLSNKTPRPNPQVPFASEVNGRQKRKYISVHIKKAVWKRANGQCENCRSQYALELDHRQPIILGGTDDLDNLRLLCRSCNERAAIEKLGMGYMQRYLK